ncbi:MAG: sugar ABC transporter permease [Ruminococcaceae bacterium]|nr:sugar ABC transporter permease [Oscillospiraceae bacterium]
MTGEIEIKQKAPKKRKIASLDKRKARVGWLFVLPFIIGLVCIYLPIIKDSLWYTFNHIGTEIIEQDGERYSQMTVEFVGLSNYQQALFGGDYKDFVPTLLTGIGNLIFEIPAILLFSLFMAVLLNQKMVGRAAFRAIFFLPVIVATGLMVATDNMESVGEIGSINDGSGGEAAEAQGGMVSTMDLQSLFGSMKVGQGLVKYVVDIINRIYSIVNRSGVQMLIFLSGLQSISPAIYEACKIDGASGWETFWKITFPMISPMILVNAVYTVIDAFTTESNTVMNYINSVGNEDVAGAMSWIYFLIVMLIIGAVAGIMSMFVFYQRKD